MDANKKIKLLVTVDVETYFFKGRLLPFETNVYAKFDGINYGVGKIMEMCDNYGIKANFFVDVYEHYKFGLNTLRELCQFINNSGHSVQLHAHPNFIPGHNNGLLKLYDFKTQDKIIKEGKQLIEDWTGKSPIAFRAGAYGANLDTIKALEKNGFLIDSSYFANHKNCGLTYKNINRPFMINNILEIPVTLYNLFNLFSWHKRSKIDINACCLSEMRNIINKIIGPGRDKLNTVILFLHSFSFIRWNNKYSRACVNQEIIDRFESLLSFLTRNYFDKAEFVRLDEFDKTKIGNLIDGDLPDYVPNVNILNLTERLLNR